MHLPGWRGVKLLMNAVHKVLLMTPGLLHPSETGPLQKPLLPSEGTILQPHLLHTRGCSFFLSLTQARESEDDGNIY